MFTFGFISFNSNNSTPNRVIENRFIELLMQNGISPEKGKFLLAVSGGIDSMALLHLFSLYTKNIVIAHVNHGLRTEESEQEEKLVLDLCTQKELTCEVLHLKGEHNGENIQVWARKKRYEWFSQLLHKYQLDYIVTAHHLDDNVETIIYNLIRGTGSAGMTGMSTISQKVLRPLLGITKSEIIAYAETNKIEYLADSSNDSTKYSRNYIRKKILPEVAQIFPNYRKRIETTRQNLASDYALLEECIAKLSRDIISNEGENITIDKQKILSFSQSDRILYRLIKSFGFTFDQASNTIVSAGSKSKKFLSNTHTLTIESDRFIIQANKENRSDTTGLIHISLHDLPCQIESNGQHFTLKHNTDSYYDPEKHALSIDTANLSFPLTLRTWKPGDFFTPIGMKGKKKKIKDFLRDIKVESIHKKDVKVLCSGEDIICVIPYRISEKIKINKEVKQDFLSLTKS